MQAFMFGFRLTAPHDITAYCIIGKRLWKQVIENSCNILLLVWAFNFDPFTSTIVFKVLKQSTCAPLCSLFAGSCTQAVDSWKGTRTRQRKVLKRIKPPTTNFLPCIQRPNSVTVSTKMLPDKISFPYSERGSGRVEKRKEVWVTRPDPIVPRVHFSATIRPSKNQSEHSDLPQDYLVI